MPRDGLEKIIGMLQEAFSNLPMRKEGKLLAVTLKEKAGEAGRDLSFYHNIPPHEAEEPFFDLSLREEAGGVYFSLTPFVGIDKSSPIFRRFEEAVTRVGYVSHAIHTHYDSLKGRLAPLPAAWKDWAKRVKVERARSGRVELPIGAYARVKQGEEVIVPPDAFVWGAMKEDTAYLFSLPVNVLGEEKWREKFEVYASQTSDILITPPVGMVEDVRGNVKRRLKANVGKAYEYPGEIARIPAPGMFRWLTPAEVRELPFTLKREEMPPYLPAEGMVYAPTPARKSV